jgi:3-deoxy-7-phosphoheptulonate synthase
VSHKAAGAEWELGSWRKRQAEQQPTYPDEQRLSAILEQIKGYPPLVFAGEVNALKSHMAKAASGRAFVLQGGDCAERFRDCTEQTITRKLKILLQMSVILCYGAKKPIVRIGRIAGQYSKPRSAPTETVDGRLMNVYRGDNINGFEANPAGRVPDPERLLHGYHLSSLTLNYIRALTTGGFADLHYPENWNLEFVGRSPHKSRYEEVVTNIQDAIMFMESLGSHEKSLGTVDFYTSHEGLLLGYEEAMTRYVPELNKYFNLGAHMLWIGDRTRQLDGAHVEYFRGIANPIGIKVGPDANPKEISEIVAAINPTDEPGRITLITRFGDGKVEASLPPLIAEFAKSKQRVLWSSDPMHGNALKTKDNVKTRDFGSILGELRKSFEIHSRYKSYLGGIHFELTGENVTECIGGSDGISLDDLDRSYETYCDPRLNNSQSLEMAFLISSMLKEHTDVTK